MKFLSLCLELFMLVLISLVNSQMGSPIVCSLGAILVLNMEFFYVIIKISSQVALGLYIVILSKLEHKANIFTYNSATGINSYLAIFCG